MSLAGLLYLLYFFQQLFDRIFFMAFHSSSLLLHCHWLDIQQYFSKCQRISAGCKSELPKTAEVPHADIQLNVYYSVARYMCLLKVGYLSPALFDLGEYQRWGVQELPGYKSHVIKFVP